MACFSDEDVNLTDAPGTAGRFKTFDNEAVLRSLAGHARRSVGADFGMVGTMSDIGHLTLRHLHGARCDALRGLQVHEGEGLGGLVLSTRRTTAVKSYLNARLITHQFDAAVRDEGLETFVALPVTVDQSVVGVLYVAQRKQQQFSDRAIHAITQSVRKAEFVLNMGKQSEAMAEVAVAHDRHRTSLELHDSVGALLFAIEAGARRIEEVAEGFQDVSLRAAEIVETASRATAALRASIADLSDSHLSRSPMAIMQADLHDLERRSGMVSRLILPDGLVEMDASTSETITVIVRELLRNAERHSGGDMVLLSIRSERSGIAATVSDNGFGRADVIVDGVGLNACRTRLQRIGGTLTFRNTSEENGLSVKVWVPAP